MTIFLFEGRATLTLVSSVRSKLRRSDGYSYPLNVESCSPASENDNLRDYLRASTYHLQVFDPVAGRAALLDERWDLGELSNLGFDLARGGTHAVFRPIGGVYLNIILGTETAVDVTPDFDRALAYPALLLNIYFEFQLSEQNPRHISRRDGATSVDHHLFIPGIPDLDLVTRRVP